MMDMLRRWNETTEEQAIEELLPCNGAREWAVQMAGRRPFENTADLLSAANAVWRALSPEQWQEAFDSHPRLGEGKAKAASGRSLTWSTEEQSRLAEEQGARAELVAANQQYELRFNRIFLLCATGKSAAEVLAALQSRLGNDPEDEVQKAAEEQRRITQLRLRRWLQLPAARCEDV